MRVISSVVLASGAVLLAGCDSGRTRNQVAPLLRPPLSGRVVAGPVNNATVRVFRVNPDRTLTLVSEGTTSASGAYQLNPTGEGPFLLLASGGSYKDEATGTTRTLAQTNPATLDDARGSTLEAFIGTGGSGPVTVCLTPLSTFASRRVAEASKTDSTAFLSSFVDGTNRGVARELGLGNIDPRSFAPLDFTDPANAAAIAASPDSPGAKLGALLAGLSSQAKALGLSDPLTLVDALAQDFAGGSFNGQGPDGSSIPLGAGTLAPDAGTAGLSAGVSSFLDDPANASGTTSSTFTNLVTAVSTQDETPPNVNKAPSFSVLANQTTNAGAGPRTLTLTGVTAGSGEDAQQTLTITATSSDATLVANPTISGTGTTRSLTFSPLLAGTVTITVVAQDTGGTANGGLDTFTRTFTVTIADAAVAPAITSTAPTDAVIGFAYTYAITVTGNPASTITVTGNPSWLVLTGTTLSGTPAAGDLGSNGPITITASNGVGTDATQTFTVTVFAPAAPSFTSSPPASVVAGTTFTYTVVAQGSPAPTLAASGLPAWLTFTNGVLAGTPTTANVGNTGTITITATNGVNPPATQAFTIAVQQAPAITSTPGTAVIQGFAYSYTIASTGFPTPALSVSGNPLWLTLSGNVLSGTPGAGDVGPNGPITVTASNGVGSNATQTFSIAVAASAAPAFTSTAPATAIAGTLYTYSVAFTGNPVPTLSSSGLPAWLTRTGNVLSGTPAVSDVGTTGTITLTATNGVNPPATQMFTITVNRVPAITSVALTTATVQQLYSYTITTTGSPAPTLSVAGNPAWLTLTGNVLSGTPVLGDLGTTGTITLTAANGVGTNATQTFQIVVSLSAPAGSWDGSNWDGATWGN